MTVEVIAVDTSYDGTVAASGRRPWLIASWPPAMVARLDSAILALPIFAEAEIRAGWLKGEFSEKRIAIEETRLSRYLRAPFDPKVIAAWTELHAAGRRNGWNAGDNDLWIAATALSRGWPVVSCDHDFKRILHPDLEVIHLDVGTKPAS